MKNRLLFLCVLACGLGPGHLVAKPLSPTQHQGVEDRLSKNPTLQEQAKLLLLLVQDAKEKNDTKDEAATRERLAKLLGSNKDFKDLAEANLYRLGALYIAGGDPVTALERFQTLLQGLDANQTSLRNLTLQSLVVAAQKANNAKLQEKYLYQYVQSRAQVEPFFKTSGGFEQLVALSQTNQSGKTQEYYEHWLEAAQKQGEAKDQTRVLNAWINHAAKAPANFSPAPFDARLAQIGNSDAKARRETLMLFAQSTPTEEKRIGIYEQVVEMDQKANQAPDLAILTLLYQTYEQKKDQAKEMALLKILAYRQDYQGRAEALRRLASLALSREDWLTAFSTHQELLALSPAATTKEGLVYLDNLISIANKLQKEEEELTHLKAKALVANQALDPKARIQAYAKAMQMLEKRKDIKAITEFYAAMAKLDLGPNANGANVKIHVFAGVSLEALTQNPAALGAYSQALAVQSQDSKHDRKEAVQLSRQVLALTQKTGGDEFAAQEALINRLEAAGDKPGHAKACLLLAQKLEKQNKKPEAIKYYNLSLADYQALKDEAKASQLMTVLLNLEGGAGEKKLEKLLELEARQAQASGEEKTKATATRIEIGHLYRQLGKMDKALESYQNAFSDSAIPPTEHSPWAAYYAGNLLSQQGRIEEANALFAAALKLTQFEQKSVEAFSQIHQSWGNNLSKAGKHEEGLAEIDKAMALKVQSRHGSLVEAKSGIMISAGQFARAEKLLLTEADQAKDKDAQIQFAILLARAYIGQGKHDKAVQTLDGAIKLKNGDVDTVTAKLGTLKAHAQNEGGQAQEAIATLQALAKGLELADDKSPLPGLYLQLVGYLINAGKLDQAAQANLAAQGWAKGDTAMSLRLQLNQGKIALKQEKLKEAETAFDGMEGDLEKAPKDLVAEFHYQRGYLHLQQSKFADASTDFAAASQHYLDLGKPTEAAQSQMARASVALQLGKMTEAEELYKSQLEQAQGGAKGDVLNALAFLYSEMGQYDKALEHSNQAEQTYQTANQETRIPEVLNAKGLIYLKMGDFATGEVTFKKALEKNQAFSNPLLDSQITNNLGGLYKNKGELDKARDQLLKTAELQKQLGFESQLALTYNNIGSVYLEEEKYPEALDFLKKSRDFAERYGLKKELAVSWNNEGILYFKQEKYGDAKSAFQEAVKLQKELDLRLDLARTQNNLGIIASQEKDFQAALDQVQQAVATLSLKPLGSGFYPNPPATGVLAPDLAKGFLMNKGGFLKELATKATGSKKRDMLEAAYLSFALSIDLIEGLRSQIKGEESQQMLMQANIDIYQQLISILFDLSELDPVGGFAEKAFYYAEMSRARSFLDQLAEQAAKASLKLPPAIREKEEALKNKVAGLDQKIFVELKKPSTERNEKLIDEWQTEKTATQLEHKAFSEDLEKKFPQFASLKYPKVYDLQMVRDKLLTDKSVALVYFVGDDRSYGFSVTKSKFRMLALPPNGDIDALVRKYRTTLKDPLVREDPDDSDLVIDATQSHVVTGLQLYRKVLEPLLEGLDSKINQMILVPDGVLYYLPFETVVVQIHPAGSSKFAKGREYLLHRYSINYSPSTSVLGTLQTQVAGRDAGEMKQRKEFLGFGDPQYKPDKGQEGSFTYNPTLKEQGFYDLDRLFNTIKELKAISDVFPSSNKVFLRDDAKEETVKANLSGYKYIHFATHGILDERNPEFSGVVMNLVTSKKPDDGFLQASEIFDLRINSDLVVLSACETGLGKVIKGEGMVGLTRAFMFAGTPSIVVSLWTVADDSTSKLMIYFYRHLAKGLDKNEALRQAKLQLMNEQEGDEYYYNDPFYWGPFILNGTA